MPPWFVTELPLFDEAFPAVDGILLPVITWRPPATRSAKDTRGEPETLAKASLRTVDMPTRMKTGRDIIRLLLDGL